MPNMLGKAGIAGSAQAPLQARMVLTLWQQHTQIPDLLAMTTALRKPTDPGWQESSEAKANAGLLPQTQCELECLRGEGGGPEWDKATAPRGAHSPALSPAG